MTGFLDVVTARHIQGWAADDRGNPVELRIDVNDSPVMGVRRRIIRPDLRHFTRKDLGFEVDLGRELEVGDVIAVTSTGHQHLSGSPHKVTRVDATREEKALWLIRRDMKILEIGPAFRPLASRASGWNSFSLDHATQEQLRLKYPEHPVDKIEPVDFLWKGGPVELAVPQSQHGTFDAIIASHVIEHIPNPIGFYQSAAALLREHGLLSLVVPDKRFTFDFFKPISTTGDLLQAQYQSRSRHTKKTAFDSIAYNVLESEQIAWEARPTGHFRFIHTGLTEAKQAFDNASEDLAGSYSDYHGTIYTPSSFALIALELANLGVFPFRIEQSFPTSGCEFYVTLRKGEPEEFSREDWNGRRLQLLKQITREIGEQANSLSDEPSVNSALR